MAAEEEKMWMKRFDSATSFRNSTKANNTLHQNNENQERDGGLTMRKSDGNTEEQKHYKDTHDLKSENNGNFSIKKSDRDSEDQEHNKNAQEIKSVNSMEQKQTENLQDQTSEDKSPGNKNLQSISPKVSGFIKLVPDLIKKLNSALKEIESNSLTEELSELIRRCDNREVNLLENNEFQIINNDSKTQSWLKSNGEEWKNFTYSLQNEFTCVIFSEEDFSKTYFCCPTERSAPIQSKITEFLDQNPADFRISPRLIEFVMHNEKFVDLKLDKVNQDEIWIRGITEPQLENLKREIKKTICQSYLLDQNQYELLGGEKKEVLSEVENDFQVKGSLYQLSVERYPAVLVNPLTSIVCVLNPDPENIPLDSLISVDLKMPRSTSGHKTIDVNKKMNFKILENESWNLPVNHHITLLVSEIRERKSTYDWDLLFEKCLNVVFKNDRSPHTIGISIPTEITEQLMEFCQNILTSLKNLPQNDRRPIYILLFVKTPKMMEEIIKILENPSDSKSGVGTAREECTVDVREGSITELKVDVVACSIDPSLRLENGEVSKSLLDKAGSKLQKECEKEYPHGIVFPEIAAINGYSLLCRRVFFGAIPRNDQNEHITTFVENCLQKASEEKLSSIAFPALGTQGLRYEPRDAAKQMTSAIEQFLAKTPESTLKKIIIVIFKQEKKMNEFFELNEHFAKVKDLKRAPQQNEREQTKNLNYKWLQWISFFNYSTRREALEDAITNFGYPDPNYFNRVTKELADKMITPNSVANESIREVIKIRNGRVVHEIRRK